MSEPTYDVVWPLGRSTSELLSTQSRVDDLDGARVAALFHVGFRDGEVRRGIEAQLHERYERVTVLDRETFGDIHGRDEAAVVAALPDKLREYAVKAAICGMGC